MRNRFSYILISFLMLGVFLAPVSPEINKTPEEISIKIEKKESLAQTTETWYLLVDNQQVLPFSSQAECNQARVIFLAQGAIVGECTQTQPTLGGALYPNFEDKLRECRVTRGTFVMGCLIHILYFFLVTIPSFLLGIAGKFLDFISAMTLSNYVYGLPFVDNVWSLLRDFANIFFILILLYAAFQIILGLGHGGGKKMIASVILMALLINFSLFISRAIIDSSNVLALIFYNKIECKLEKKNSDGTKEIRDCAQSKIIDSPEEMNKIGVVERPVSESFVAALDINQFFKGEWLNSLPKNDADGDGKEENSYWETKACPGLTGCYQVTLNNYLAAALIAVYGLFIWPMVWIFFTIGLSLLSRMIMLVIYMIVSPIAFATAAVPKFSNVDTIGFNSWIRKILETSFVATILMAIFYLVAKIMQPPGIFSGIGSTDQKVIEAIIIIFIPFAIVFIFLKKGSDYAKKATGEFTGALLGGVKILGGLALGGAALGAAGAAAAGRQTIGSVNKYIQNDSARDKDKNLGSNLKDAWTYDKKWKRYNPLNWAGSVKKSFQATGKAGAAWVAQSTFTSAGVKDAAGRPVSLGKGMQKSVSGIKEKEHAMHLFDEMAQKITGNKDAVYKDLSDKDQEKVKDRIDRDIYSKETYNRPYDRLTDVQKQAVDAQKGVFDYTTNTFRQDPNGNYQYAALTAQQAADQRGESIHTAGEMAQYLKANTAMGEFVRSLQKGSYDVRNLSDIKKKGLVTAIGAGMIATGIGAPVGLGMMAGSSGALRNALKQGASEYGKGQKDFLKDLGEILTGAFSSTMKNVKIRGVEIEKGGHGGGGGAHGGGGGGHH